MRDTITPEVAKLAQLAREQFDTLKDDKGETVERDGVRVYVAKGDSKPEWFQELCHEAHGDMLPDDWRYSFIVEALDAIADNEGREPAEVADEACEADVYNSDRTAWLHSRVDRYGYCDEACEELGVEKADTMERIGLGQMYERQEVFFAVLASLGTIADDAESDDA